MGRKMYSESQLNNMIDSKLKGFNARIPTDLASDDLPNASLIHLEHRSGNSSVVIGDSVYLKKILGNSIIGEGSIGLYNHHISMEGNNGIICCFTFVSTNSIVANNRQNLNTLLGSVNKPISCSGLLPNDNGTLTSVFLLDWKGELTLSKFYLSDRTSIFYSGSGIVRYSDVVESV